MSAPLALGLPGTFCEAETAPFTPALDSLDLSSLVWVERTTWPSGSYFFSLVVTRFMSRSAVTCTRARPGPTTPSTMFSTVFLIFSSTSLRSAPWAATPASPAPARRSPDWSATATRSGLRSGTAPETRFLMARTCSAPSRRVEFSMMEAEAWASASSSNSCFLGMFRSTRADETPRMAPMVRASSPSSARWRFSCWTKSVWPSAGAPSKIS